jgi:hypothetical protein
MNVEQKDGIRKLIDEQIKELHTLKNDTYHETLINLLDEKIKWWEATAEALEPKTIVWSLA